MYCICFSASRSRPLRQTEEPEPSKKKDLIISSREKKKVKNHTKPFHKEGYAEYRYYDEKRKKETGTHVHNDPRPGKEKKVKRERPSKLIKRRREGPRGMYDMIVGRQLTKGRESSG
jgi:hypothetical protein